MQIDLKRYWQKVNSFQYINLVYISVFLAVLMLFWTKIVALFKSPDDAKNQDVKVTDINVRYRSEGRVSSDGYFMLGGNMSTYKSQYSITKARSDSEQLSALLNTYKGSHWYSTTLSFFGFGVVPKIKAILNPNYPSNYRRYVTDCYRDVYTDGYRSLSVDVRSGLTGFAGSSYWDVNLTKYFQF